MDEPPFVRWKELFLEDIFTFGSGTQVRLFQGATNSAPSIWGLMVIVQGGGGRERKQLDAVTGVPLIVKQSL